MGLRFSRKQGRAFTIGDNIRVTIYHVSGKTVYLDIEAPGLRVLRDDAKHREPKEDEARK